MDAVSLTADPTLAANGISDRRFAAQLEAIQKLKRFLFDEKVLLQTDVLESIDLGSLNNLKYAPTAACQRKASGERLTRSWQA
jgi:hypothetical protein